MTSIHDLEDLEAIKAQNLCPDCKQPAILDFYQGGLSSFRRGGDDMEANRKMPEARCPNRRHEMWRGFMGLPEP